ncbi:hypothetical protein GCM10027418_10370 [Mariniluteicoccus endophyticus]
MGTTGLIFGAVALAWLAYLVPMWVRRNSSAPATSIDLDERFSDSVQLVRDEADLEVEHRGEDHEVSTPLTRRAQLTALKRRDGLATARRRSLFLLIMIALVVVSGLSIAGVLLPWAPAIPVGLLGLYVVMARVNIRSMDRERREILDALKGFETRTEETVVLTAGDLETVRTVPGSSKVTEVDLGAPKPSEGGAIWDAVPVTAPTYVQTPTPPRTVRTIDLSAPSVPKPVTADPRSAQTAAEVEVEHKKAVGE